MPEPVVPAPEVEVGIPDYYAVATDTDFTKVLDTYAPNKSYYWRYIGSDEFVIIPETINGEAVTDYYRMFGQFIQRYGERGGFRKPECDQHELHVLSITKHISGRQSS